MARRRPANGRRLARVFPLLLIGAAVVHAAGLSWICDDAFITFRYAENAVAGEGLVFNAGERVEGYTNPLWTVMVTAGMALGAEPVALVHTLGVGFFAATLMLLLAAGRIFGSHGVAPVAAVGLACHWHSKTFATCGLETSMFSFLVTALLVATLVARRARGFAVAGLLGTATMLTRMDGALLYGVAGVYTLWYARRQRSWRPWIAMLAPALLLYLPYFLWRWSYYGSFVPNLFYAKSVGEGYLEQGVYYVAKYFECYWVLLLALVAVLVLALRRSCWQPAFVLIGAFVGIYCLFVAWVGGDFMFTRFLLPITPVLFLALQFTVVAHRRLRLHAAWCAAGVGAATLLMLYPAELQQRGERPLGFVEERAVYTEQVVEESRNYGRCLGALTRGVDTRVGIFGGQAMVAFEAKWPVVIECATGLTDPVIARQPLETRGLVGHEKPAPLDYLAERGVHFLLFGPRHVGFDGPLDHLREMKVAHLTLTIVTWSRAVMRHFDRFSAVIRRTDIEAYLDRYIAELPAKSHTQLVHDYAWFRSYYFDHNADRPRQEAFERALSALQPVEALASGRATPRPLPAPSRN